MGSISLPEIVETDFERDPTQQMINIPMGSKIYFKTQDGKYIEPFNLVYQNDRWQSLNNIAFEGKWISIAVKDMIHINPYDVYAVTVTLPTPNGQTITIRETEVEYQQQMLAFGSIVMFKTEMNQYIEQSILKQHARGWMAPDLVVYQGKWVKLSMQDYTLIQSHGLIRQFKSAIDDLGVQKADILTMDHVAEQMLEPVELKTIEKYGKTFCNKKSAAYIPGQILYKYDMYWFASFETQDRFLDYIEQCPPDDLCFFEVLMGNKPQKLFCDIDGMINDVAIERFEIADEDWLVDKKNNLNKEELLESFIAHLADCFKKCGMPFREEDLIVLDSCKDKKLSYHLIYNDRDGMVFQNSVEQARFWDYVRITGQQFEYIDISTDQKGERSWALKSFVDDRVYDKDRAMRLAGCFKAGQPERPLKHLLRKKNRHGKLMRYEYSTDGYVDSKYLIMVPDADQKQFYRPELPNEEAPKMFKPVSEKEIMAIIESKINATAVIDDICGNLVPLRNSTAGRRCLINPVTHTRNNAYCLIRRDCITYHCHATECKNQQVVIHKFQDLKSIATKQRHYYWQQYKTITRWTLADLHEYFRQTTGIIISGGSETVVIYQLDDEGNTSYEQLMPNKNPYGEGKNSQQIEVLYPGQEKHVLSTYAIEFDKVWRQIQYHGVVAHYTGITFTPYLDTKPVTQSMNLFKPFNSYDPDFIYDRHIEVKHVEPILSHIRDVWCRGDIESYSYMIGWLAHLVQKPNEKPGITILLRSMAHQSGGKSMFWDKFMPHVINEHYYRFSDNIKQVVEDQFNTLSANKLLLFIDELSDDVRYNADVLKCMATAKRKEIRTKFKLAYMSNDKTRIVCASNHDNPFTLEEQDERVFCLDCGAPAGDNDKIKAYYTKLGETAMGINRAGEQIDPTGAKAFMYFLSHYDLAKWNMANIPVTEFRTQLMERNMCVVKRYVAHLVANRKNGWYSDFQKWCADNGLRYVKQAQNFWQSVRRYVPDELIRPAKHASVGGPAESTKSIMINPTRHDYVYLYQHPNELNIVNANSTAIVLKIQACTKVPGYIERLLKEVYDHDMQCLREATNQSAPSVEFKQTTPEQVAIMNKLNTKAPDDVSQKLTSVTMTEASETERKKAELQSKIEAMRRELELIEMSASTS